jgi:hypothetical protein
MAPGPVSPLGTDDLDSLADLLRETHFLQMKRIFLTDAVA